MPRWAATPPIRSSSAAALSFQGQQYGISISRDCVAARAGAITEEVIAPSARSRPCRRGLDRAGRENRGGRSLAALRHLRRAALELLGGHVFLVSSDVPVMTERVLDRAHPVAVELVLDRLEHLG